MPREKAPVLTGDVADQIRTTLVQGVEDDSVLEFLVEKIREGSVLRIKQTIASFDLEIDVIRASERVQSSLITKISALEGSNDVEDERIIEYLRGLLANV